MALKYTSTDDVEATSRHVDAKLKRRLRYTLVISRQVAWKICHVKWRLRKSFNVDVCQTLGAASLAKSKAITGKSKLKIGRVTGEETQITAEKQTQKTLKKTEKPYQDILALKETGRSLIFENTKSQGYRFNWIKPVALCWLLVSYFEWKRRKPGQYTLRVSGNYMARNDSPAIFWSNLPHDSTWLQSAPIDA